MSIRPLDTADDALKVQRSALSELGADQRLRTALEMSEAVRHLRLAGFARGRLLRDPEGHPGRRRRDRRDRLFSIEEFEPRHRVETMGLVLPMVTPEDLIVAKLEWARKGASDLQLRDAAAILAEHGQDLDRDHLERWIGELGLEGEWKRVREDVDPWDRE